MEGENQQKKETPKVDEPKPIDYSNIVKPLRTYERDIAESIRNSGASVVSVQVAEQVKKEKEVEHETAAVASTYAKNTLITVISIILVVVAVGTLGVLYYIKQQTPNPNVVHVGVEDTAITVDKTREVDMTDANGEKIKKILKDERVKEGGGAGTITYLKLTEKGTGANPAKKIIAAGEIMGKIAESAGAPLIRAFNDLFMYGFHNFSQTEPFMIVGISSFDNAFDGILSYEKNIWKNFAPFLSRGTGIVEARPTFEDAVIKNRDVRILKSTGGETILLYSFLNEKTLLITTNEGTFREVLNRFLASKLIR